MAGTGDQMIANAKSAQRAAEAKYQTAASSQASPGHETRLKDAERELNAATANLEATERRWGK